MLHLLLLFLAATGVSAEDSLQRIRRAAIAGEKDPAQAMHKIIDLADCQDLKKLCTHQKSTDNLSMLECALTFSSSQLEELSESCQHELWLQQRQLQLPAWIENTFLPAYCPAEQSKLESCLNSVHMWSCLDQQRLKLPQNNACHQHLRRGYEALGQDYSAVDEFYSACGSLVEEHKCGRLNIDHLPSVLAQLGTVQCLQSSADKSNIEPVCMSAISSIELQRGMLELFRVCQNDLAALCPQEKVGTAGAFKCLVRHKNHSAMTPQCASQITQRDQQMGRDYRVSHGLAKACKEDIKLYHCRRGVSEDKHVRLAQILLCLESVSKNGTRLAPACLTELIDHRRMLMTDYQLSPELLNDCADDIPKFCPDEHKAQLVNGVSSTGGEIIHCLLEHVKARRQQRRVTAQCQRGLETLIKVSDAGEDWRVDPVLRRACKPVVDVACKDVEGGEARVMSCLVERIGTPVMLPDCEQALLIIEYFVARDFKLDPQLYKHCRDDAVKYCRAKRQWDDVQNIQMDPERGPMILPCLHRMAFSEDETQTLRKDCFKEVKRVMRQRAISMDLMPEVEDYCLNDLSLFCADCTEKGSEMECLQKNMDQLQAECKTVVVKYTEEEAAHVELNPVIMTVCGEAMQQHCSDILKSGKDNGDMMDCLIAHKNDADLRKDLRCRAAIEHFQIISLKNFHFTTKFKEACRPFVQRFCSSSATKNEVVACLSEVMRNDTIKAQRHQIPKECRHQVKAQLYQQRESMQLDPKLANACKRELEQFCEDQKGPGQVNEKALECLVRKTTSLGKPCHHAIFLVKKSELGDSGTDYTLLNTCKDMIYKFCPKIDSVKLLDCLKTYKDDTQFDQRCHLVVVNRMIEQNTDFRFNPSLQTACGKNIDRYCSNIVASALPNEELNGKVIHCLKDKFRQSALDEPCAQEMIKILQDQALNYKLNPLLQVFCKSEIQELCKANMEADEHGQVAECLKTAFLQKQIINRQCQVEVATLIAEAKADIHVDPILENACIVDLLRYCSKVAAGNGRKLSCLRTLLKDTPNSLEADCREKLERRIEMFHNADDTLALPPEDVQQLVQQVVASPARKFFLVILMSATGMVFLTGIFLGRATKRAMGLKNK
ncbi:Golgi apparatus protein 1 isoform X1 [Drosophila serrata]|uniref:Golgi apparatus protein 1 isoform X1 n=1 Tax=Drosophila serrata TaxID=7274 RepID=UPI000A1D0E27|nr:Golgi apparatus protein 1 isoform X1 [Drosophila serrata]XP_020816563.1 Golgi apparatus protein 1 isoform X1 [Drosophila serrata]